jgi:hypothetical protein
LEGALARDIAAVIIGGTVKIAARIKYSARRFYFFFRFLCRALKRAQHVRVGCSR